jgi:hypothetical protein
MWMGIGRRFTPCDSLYGSMLDVFLSVIFMSWTILRERRAHKVIMSMRPCRTRAKSVMGRFILKRRLKELMHVKMESLRSLGESHVTFKMGHLAWWGGISFKCLSCPRE